MANPLEQNHHSETKKHTLIAFNRFFRCELGSRRNSRKRNRSRFTKRKRSRSAATVLQPALPMFELDPNNPENRYEVEYIDGHGIYEGIFYYRVAWVGYDHITWEPADNLDQCSEALAEYRTRFPTTREYIKKAVIFLESPKNFETFY